MNLFSCAAIQEWKDLFNGHEHGGILQRVFCDAASCRNPFCSYWQRSDGIRESISSATIGRDGTSGFSIKPCADNVATWVAT
jgi:hypothetical protein